MSYFEEINIKIAGQVKEPITKRQVIAELEVICAKYDLDLNEIYEECI